MIKITLTKRGELAYKEIKQYIDAEEDLKLALIKVVRENIKLYNSFELNVMNWISYDPHFTSSERQLFNSFISQYGLLPFEQAIWKICSEYEIEDTLNKVKVK